ncbi:hypothetical protein NQ318_014803 [Aromia moschata]|uniref:Secreted protein n=1 Tax=Aromia moschata TaxID=1265417 RepID=A0AAV8ZB40_9CUCU|nr:hypothetical protein NQ318_014803 [Aromia moschata]
MWLPVSTIAAICVLFDVSETSQLENDLEIVFKERVDFISPKSLHCDLNGSPSTPQKPTPCRNLNSEHFGGNFSDLQGGLRRTLSGKNFISGYTPP